MKKKNPLLRIIFQVLKILIFIATVWYILNKLTQQDFDKFLQELNVLNFRSYLLIAAGILLMPLNWALETIKWKKLVSRFGQIKFSRAFRAVWAGVSMNNWIPNRTGEFLGRILFIDAGQRTRAVFATFTGNLAQLIMTVAWGLAGILVWYHFKNTGWFVSAVFFFLLITGFLFYIYFNIKILHRLICKIGFLGFLKPYSEIMGEYSRKDLERIIALSCIRYLVYLLQYVLFLYAFGIRASFLEISAGVALIFLVQAVVPSVTLTEIGIRGAAVLFFIGKFSVLTGGMIASAYILWLVNIILPGLAGSLFILGLKTSTVQIKAEQ